MGSPSAHDPGSASDRGEGTRKERRKEDSGLIIWAPRFSFSGDAFALDHVTAVGLITDFPFDDDDLDVVGDGLS